MNHNLKLKITLSGNGTRSEVAKSLHEMARTIERLTDAEISEGGDMEDHILAGPYDEQIDPV